MWLERDTDLHVMEFCDITANIRAKFLNTQNESSCQSYRTGYWKNEYRNFVSQLIKGITIKYNAYEHFLVAYCYFSTCLSPFWTQLAGIPLRWSWETHLTLTLSNSLQREFLNDDLQSVRSTQQNAEVGEGAARAWPIGNHLWGLTNLLVAL